MWCVYEVVYDDVMVLCIDVWYVCVMMFVDEFVWCDVVE